MKYILSILLFLVCLTQSSPTKAANILKSPLSQSVHTNSHEEQNEGNQSLTNELDLRDCTLGMRYGADEVRLSWHARTALSLAQQRATKPWNDTTETVAQRLQKLPCLVPMTYNEVVQSYVDQFLLHQKEWLALMLGLQNLYAPIIEDALEEYSVPLECRWLPALLSALNPNATQHNKSTVGLWQLTLSQAKKTGLVVNSLIDERRDPLRSSQAAAQLLKEYYQRYNDWRLAIVALTAGSNTLEKALARSGNTFDYWSIANHLPRTNRAYVPAFIAITYITHYHCHYDLPTYNVEIPTETDTLHLQRSIHLTQVAEACRLPLEEIAALNPQYRKGTIPAASPSWSLRLPSTALNSFLTLGDAVYQLQQQPYENNDISPTAVPKQNNLNTALDEEEYGVSAIRLQKSKGRNSKRESKKKKREHQRERTITIKSGDTLIDIARRNGTTVEKLRRQNGIKGSSIRAGKKIRIR